MGELVYPLHLGCSVREDVWVRVPPGRQERRGSSIGWPRSRRLSLKWFLLVFLPEVKVRILASIKPTFCGVRLVGMASPLQGEIRPVRVRYSAQDMENFNEKRWKKNSRISKVCDFFSRTIPYCPIIFKDIRARVRCRKYFKYWLLRKQVREMCNVLMKCRPAVPVDYTKINVDNFFCEWEIKSK